MDGVIINSEPLHVIAEQEACRIFQIPIPHSEWRQFKGKTSKSIFEYILNKYTDGSIAYDDILRVRREIYKKLVDEQLVLVPGVLDFLTFARSRYPLIALTTSTAAVTQQYIFDQFDLAKHFDTIITGDMVNNGKPHPEPYLLTAEKLAIHPSGMVVIEDSDNGIRSAKAAGAYVIGITTSFEPSILKDAGADMMVESFDQLRTLYPPVS